MARAGRARPAASPGEAFIPQHHSSAPHSNHRLLRLMAEARWLLFSVIALYLLLILFTHSMADPGWSRTGEAATLVNKGGRAGAVLADILYYLFGFSAWWWAVLFVKQVVIGLQRLRTWMQGGTVWNTPPAALLLSAAGFLLLLLGSSGIEALRFHHLTLALPYAPGGVIGELLSHLQHSLGFTGAMLSLLLAVLVGFSLHFQVSWLTVAERVGEGLERLVQLIKQRRELRVDRAVGEIAAAQREEQVEQDRAHFDDAKPIRIEPALTEITRSERVAREKQKPLFSELPDSTLPTIDLLDPPPVNQQFVSTDTMEFTSR